MVRLGFDWSWNGALIRQNDLLGNRFVKIHDDAGYQCPGSTMDRVVRRQVLRRRIGCDLVGWQLSFL